jgi:hypothetical protein
MEQEIRNKLRNVVTQCRRLLEDAIAQELEGKYGIFAKKDQVTADPSDKMKHLSEEEQAARKDILDHYAHIKARGFKAKDALDQLIREIAFTHLNRLCAYKMMESREVYVCGQKFREAVSRGVNSNGVKFYLAEHPEEERLFNTGQQDVAYRHFLDWLGGALSDEIGVLFNPNDPANRLYPRQKTLVDVLDLLNGGGIKAEETELREQWPLIWSQDETIGWVYQYFTPKELRDQARKESQAPRNSYELAFRNQFFTPRYVVEFLTDNTLGRIWYEMRKGETSLKDQCRYMVRRATEVFLKEGEQPPKDAAEGKDDLSQEELLKLPVHIPHRPKKDPRELKILDPACGSGHFLLYCFDLLLTIYEEAYADPDLGPALKKDYPTLDSLKRDVPRFILAHNLHGIDIDLRASQIAALALWLRCQRAYQEMGLKQDRPQITRSNFVCAEPMPGEEQMLKEFVGQLEPKVLGQVVEVVFDKMKLAGEAGSLLKIEEEIREAICEAKRQYAIGGISIQRTLFDKPTETEVKVFSVKDITDAQFFEGAESQVIEALRSYSEKAQNGQRLQRRLFSEDAVRGFAFVDLCQKRYDVVLMNPPFGTASTASISHLATDYPTWNKNILCAFIERGLDLLTSTGALGAIFDRTAAIKSTYEDFRRSVFFDSDRPRYCADLGWEVLDANVETSTLVWHSLRPIPNDAIFIDLRNESPETKGLALHNRLCDPLHTFASVVPVHAFLSLPNAAMGYDMPRFFIALASHRSSLKNSGLQSFTGAQMRAEQHFRVFWECDKDQRFSSEYDFCYMYNGGEYSRYFMPPRDVALYGRNGCCVNESDESYSWRIQSKHAYFKTAVGFGVRGDFLDAHYLRDGYLFTVEGQSAPIEDEYRKLVLLGILNSAAFQVAINSFCGQHKYSGYLNLFPCPDFGHSAAQTIASTVSKAISTSEQWYTHDQSCLLFSGVPWVLMSPMTSLPKCYTEYVSAWQEYHDTLADCFAQCEASVAEILHVTASTDMEQVASVYNRLCELHESPLSIEECVADLLDYCVAVSLGRWDVRCLNAKDAASAISAAPTPYPCQPPASLNDRIGTSPVSGENGYPVAITDTGFLIDDAEHPDDIVRRLRDVGEVIWNRHTEQFEKEACGVLGVKELRDYFRKPGKGGFWDDHISRYTKSRRKAPIYWLLQSSKKNYAIWLYYHRLDKDLLFKALVNYVEPKIRLETSRLESLRTQKAAAGDSGKEAKRLAKEVEKQEDFLSELRDFEEKLRRAANRQLEPDLNDGVVLNIAPLHELVPWKEARKYWDELLEGKYEWSSIGKQLREKGLVT